MLCYWSSVYLCVGYTQKTTEMDLLVFIKTWNLVENMQIYKLCGKWLNLSHLNMLARRKGAIELHIGWFVSGQVDRREEKRGFRIWFLWCIDTVHVKSNSFRAQFLSCHQFCYHWKWKWKWIFGVLILHINFVTIRVQIYISIQNTHVSEYLGSWFCFHNFQSKTPTQTQTPNMALTQTQTQTPNMTWTRIRWHRCPIWYMSHVGHQTRFPQKWCCYRYKHRKL